MGASDEQPAQGPPLHVIATYPVDGQGTNALLDADCDAPTPDCPVPTNPELELRFDRFLLPTGGLAAAVRLYSGYPPANGVALKARYDLIERVVVLRPTRSLQPHTLYTVEVAVGPDPSRGFWAFDHAPLEEGAVPLRFSFTTGGGPRPASAPAAETPKDTCATISAGPLASCVTCHRTTPSSAPPMGLDLASAQGFLATAVARVAHETETGDTITGPALRSPPRFGVRMAVVDPGSPATSYLMYKLLQKPENFRLDPSEPACETGYQAPVDTGGCTAPDPDELARLREWFVRGDPMPQDPQTSDLAGVPTSLTRADLLRISGWIEQGAVCAPTH